MVVTLSALQEMVSEAVFQSPFHRGNGCNGLATARWLLASLTFSPLFIGAMVVTKASLTMNIYFVCFQSPFHRGNGCNQHRLRQHRCVNAFSPLFIGAMVVTQNAVPCPSARRSFSPLFIGAMVVTQHHRDRHMRRHPDFQSPFHRGNGCNSTATSPAP